MIELRASSLGSCTKAQAALHLGYEAMLAPTKMEAIYERGNVHEERNAVALRGGGFTIEREQEEICLGFDAGSVVGHIDGVIADPLLGGTPGLFLWESKSPGAWQKFQSAHMTADWSDPLAHRYAWQISAYMLALNMEAMVTCWDEEGGNRWFVIETPPFTLDQIRGRIEGIATIVDTGGLPIECSQRDWPCPVPYLHEDPDYAENEELDKAVQDHYFAGVMLKEWKVKQDHAKEKVERLVDKDTETATSKVTYYNQSSPSKWDTKKMEQAGIDPEAYKIPGGVTQRIKITKKDGTNVGE